MATDMKETMVQTTNNYDGTDDDDDNDDDNNSDDDNTDDTDDNATTTTPSPTTRQHVGNLTAEKSRMQLLFTATIAARTYAVPATTGVAPRQRLHFPRQ